MSTASEYNNNGREPEPAAAAGYCHKLSHIRHISPDYYSFVTICTDTRSVNLRFPGGVLCRSHNSDVGYTATHTTNTIVIIMITMIIIKIIIFIFTFLLFYVLSIFVLFLATRENPRCKSVPLVLSSRTRLSNGLTQFEKCFGSRICKEDRKKRHFWSSLLHCLCQFIFIFFAKSN